MDTGGKVNDLTGADMEPRRPTRTGWVRTLRHGQGRVETWVHQETGLAAVSTVTACGGSAGAAVYSLMLNPSGGARCCGALAMLALADFDLLDASEVRGPCSTERFFRFSRGCVCASAYPDNWPVPVCSIRAAGTRRTADRAGASAQR